MTDILQINQEDVERPRPKSVKGLSMTAALLLGGVAFMECVLFPGLLMRFVLVRRLMAHISVSRTVLLASDGFIRLVSFATLPLTLACAVVFCIWIYRAYKNLRAFRLGGLIHSPAMAPGSFFIPFANLVLPYLIMKEIWRGSDPAFPPLETDPSDDARVTPLLLPWWLLFLGRGVAAWIAILVSHSERSLAALNVSTIALLVSCAFGIVSAGFAAAVVIGIGRRQGDLTAALQRTRAIPI